MRRIAFLLLGLCLTVGMVGCAEDTATDTDTTTPPPATDGTDTTTPPADGAAAPAEGETTP